MPPSVEKALSWQRVSPTFALRTSMSTQIIPVSYPTDLHLYNDNHIYIYYIYYVYIYIWQIAMEQEEAERQLSAIRWDEASTQWEQRIASSSDACSFWSGWQVARPIWCNDVLL